MCKGPGIGWGLSRNVVSYNYCMITYVWVLGPTAVGKDTFINRLASGELENIAQSLGLEKPFIVHREALDLRHEERAELYLKIARHNHKEGTVLLKWQGADVGHRNLQHLESSAPESKFLYLFLDASPDAIKSRRVKRGQQPNSWNDVNDRNECLSLAESLQSDGLKIIWLDNRNNIPTFINRPLNIN